LIYQLFAASPPESFVIVLQSYGHRDFPGDSWRAELS
jgi:hypothetical protein